MNLQQRIGLVYDVLRPYPQLGHNELWKQVQLRFKTNKSFSYVTFDNTLKEMVELNIVYRQEDKESKLGRVWYSVLLHSSELNAIVPRNIETFVDVINDELGSVITKFSKLNNYDKAIELSKLYQVIVLYELITQKYIEMFPKNKGLKTLLRRWRKLGATLNKLSQADDHQDNTEVNQLLLKEITNVVGKLWSETVLFNRTLKISKH